MSRKEAFSSMAEELNKKKRALDVLRLLIEDGDAETALVVGLKLRGEIDRVIAGLQDLAGADFDAEAALAAHKSNHHEPEAAGASAPADVRRGQLGDDEGPGKLEIWVEKAVRGLWSVVAEPKKSARWVNSNRSRLFFLIALGFAVFFGYQAYDRIYLANFGLTGEYYAGTDFKTLFAKRLDHTVNFRWLRRPPMKNFRAEDFSVRWTGYVKIVEGGTYEFYTISDDGVRLWINDQAVIDNWTIHGGTLDKGEIKLDPGFHRVKLEYYQGAGDMVIKLHWKRPGDSWKKVIPARSLFPEIPK